MRAFKMSSVVLLASMATLGVSSSDWGDSYMKVNYEGQDSGKVDACAFLAGEVIGIEIAKTSVPGIFHVGDVVVVERDGIHEITGHIVDVADESRSWAWSCRVSVGSDKRSLTADLVAVTPVES